MRRHFRQVCFDAAARIVHIVREYTRRFSLKNAFTTVVLQCSIAANVVVASLNFKSEQQNLAQKLGLLQLLHGILEEQANAFEPAERIARTLVRIMRQWGVASEQESGLGAFIRSNSHEHNRDVNLSSAVNVSPSTHQPGPDEEFRISIEGETSAERYGPEATKAHGPLPNGSNRGAIGAGEADFVVDSVFSPFKDEMMHILTATRPVDSGGYLYDHGASEAQKGYATLSPRPDTPANIANQS